MRVLHFGKYTKTLFGGIETHVQALTNGLAAAGVDVVDLVYAPDGRFDRVDDGVRTVGIQPWLTLASQPLTPALATQALALHRAKPFDVVHMHGPDPLAHLVIGLLPTRVVSVVSWHSDIVNQPRLGSAYRWLSRHGLRRFDGLIAATPAHLRSSQIPVYLTNAQRRVIPYGINLDRFALTDAMRQQADAIRADVITRSGAAHIAFALGRHVGYKGFEYLIRAAVAVPDCAVVIGGDGPLRPSLQRLAAELGLARRVIFPGLIADAQLPAYHHAADLFCFPSHLPAEAFGIAQAEAMCCGKPVINCDLANGVTLVNIDGETGLTVAPRDVEQFAAAMRRLLADPALRARFGQAGRTRVERHFSEALMVRETIDFYQQLSRARSQ